MIELTVKGHLERKLQVAVFMEFPANPPPCFVVLKKGDSGRENMIDTAMLVVDSYAASLYETATLNEKVKSALDSLTELDSVCHSTRGGDYPFFDTKNKRYRYQAVQNITHY